MLLNTVLLAIIIYSNSISLRDGAFQIAENLHIRIMKDQARSLALNYEFHQGWDKVVKDDLLITQLMFPGSAYQPPNERFAGEKKQTAQEFINSRPKGLPGTPSEHNNHNGPRTHKTKNEKPVHLWIYDKDKKLIRGVEEPRFNFRIIEIKLNNELIGYLGRPMSREIITSTRNEVFNGAEKQLYIGIFIAICVSILLAFLLATFFIKPINLLSKTVHKLASGDFAQRVDFNGKDEISRLAYDVNFLADALEQSKHSREAWIRDIGHELHTPLTVIKGELELIQSGIQEPDQDSIQSLIQEFDQLNHLIDDLSILAESDLGALGFDKHEFDLRDFLQKYNQKAQTQLMQNDLTFTFHSLNQTVSIFADSHRLRQLLDNLLQNSIRYTYKPGTVELSLNIKNDNIIIQWKDSSPGVKALELGKLFDRLYRTENTSSRAVTGSGLGLSICKAIITSHQGKIWAEDSNTGGVSINIELPLNQF